MAINQIIIGQLKHIFYILLILFLIYPVSASDQTFYFNLSSSSQNTEVLSYTVKAGSDVIASIHVNDMAAFQGVQHIILTASHAYWAGPSGNSEWDAVQFKIGSTVIATGTFGFNKGASNYYVGAFFDEENQIFDQYSGAQGIEIIGSYPAIRWNDAGTVYDGSLGTDADMGYLALGSGGGTHAICGRTGVSTTQTTISYDFSNKILYDTVDGNYNLWIEKLGQNSKYNISNSYEVFFKETSVNTNDQHIINTDTQNYTWLVKAENAYGDLFSKTIDMSYDPQTEDTIVWGADSYVVDDTGSYTWVLSDSNWDTVLYSKKASIYRDETLVHEVSLPTQTGTFYYTFEEEGTFTVKLRHTSALLPHVTIDSDTVSVTPIGESFIGVTNTTVYINTPIGFQFSYGFTPLPVSPGVWSSATSIEARKLIDGDWITVNRWFYPELGDVTPNVLYTYTIGTTGAYSDSMLVSEGDYIFYLTDFNHGDVASTNVYTVEYQPGAPTENITTTYLNILSGESYKFDDLFTFKYGIDNTNFTSGVNYIEIYNYDHEVITQSVLLFKQSWYKDGYIFPPSDDDPTELFQYGGIVALPGNNTMRIRHDDINGSTELVHDNFTLSELTNRGFGLKLSKYEACINEPILISITIPSDANLTIFSPSGIEIVTYNLNASTVITYYFPVSGQYILKLIPSGETYEEARATIYISDCADDGIIEPPSGEMDDMYLNMFNFMTLPIFWGMIIFIGFIGGLAMKTNRLGDHLVSGNGLAFIAFGLLNLLAFIGMLAPYTMYAIVSTWIFAGIFFGVGRFLARGE